MKIATIRTPEDTRAVLVDGEEYKEIQGIADVGELLRRSEWRELADRADGPTHSARDVELAPVIPVPGKIICVGQNYREHVREMNSSVPDHPTLFAKFAESLIGAQDDIELPAEDPAVDWEAELAVVIGHPARRVPAAEVPSYIAGYSVLNDVSMRGYQFRTMQWLQGKTWEHSTPFGPYLVTPEEFSPEDAAIMTRVDGETLQSASTSDLIFTPADLVAYISQIITLQPGDVIATGTPHGVGHAETPPRYLTEGSVLETSIEGLGTLSNRATSNGSRTARVS